MRIAICGIHIESSTFTPYLSQASDFDVTRGAELINRYPFLTNSPIPGIENVPAHLAGVERSVTDARQWAEKIDWVPILHARALPGGPVERETYEGWKKEICQLLKECGPLDGLFFDIHGAMSTPGLDDAEGDLITEIRRVIGPDVLVGGAWTCMETSHTHSSSSQTCSPVTGWHPMKMPG